MVSFVSTFAGFCAGPLAAQPFILRPASELLGAAAYEEAATKGKAVRTSEGGTIALLPSHPAADPIRAAIVVEKPGVLVEAAFVLPRNAPDTIAGRQAELAAIYGLLGSFSSMEGIQYWSASRNAWRTFYAESYRVNGPDAKLRLADPPAPKPGALPASEDAVAFQRDLSFGANLYRYSFHSYTDAMSLESTNLTKMSYSLVPVMAAGALKTRLLVIQARDAIVFYAASGADAPAMFRGKLEDSFGNRAEALFRWFSQKAGAFIK